MNYESFSFLFDYHFYYYWLRWYHILNIRSKHLHTNTYHTYTTYIQTKSLQIALLTIFFCIIEWRICLAYNTSCVTQCVTRGGFSLYIKLKKMMIAKFKHDWIRKMYMCVCVRPFDVRANCAIMRDQRESKWQNVEQSNIIWLTLLVW